MPDLKEVFEMVSHKVEPDLDAWNEQVRLRRRSARNRKVGALVLASALALATAVVASWMLPGTGDRIDRTGDQQPSDEGGGFLLIDAETGTREAIGRSGGGNPDVSPDGTVIAFTQEVDGYNQIFVMNVDGSGVTQVTEARFGAEDPDWSPNGESLVYGSLFEGEEMTDWDIWIVNLASGRERQLTHEPGEAFAPAWSPDGSSILYTVGRSSDVSVLRVVHLSTGQITKLTDRGESAAEGSWSPDGGTIVYSLDAVSGGPGGPRGVWVMNADGAHRREVVPGPAVSFGPQFSPDGTRVVYFVEDADGCCDTYVVDVDSGDARKLTEATLFPTWFDDDTVLAVDYR